MVNVAKVHELGKTVVVQLTEASRRFVAMVMREAGVEYEGGGGKTETGYS